MNRLQALARDEGPSVQGSEQPPGVATAAGSMHRAAGQIAHERMGPVSTLCPERLGCCPGSRWVPRPSPPACCRARLHPGDQWRLARGSHSLQGTEVVWGAGPVGVRGRRSPEGEPRTLRAAHKDVRDSGTGTLQRSMQGGWGLCRGHRREDPSPSTGPPWPASCLGPWQPV